MPGAILVDEVMSADVLTARPDVSTLEAMKLMAQRGVGSIVVTNGDDRPLGIFTDRDLFSKIVLKNLDPACVPVGEVVTRDIVSVGSGSSLDDAHEIMMKGDFRHLIVSEENGRMKGIISVKDLIRHRELALEKKVNEKTSELMETSKQLMKSLNTIEREMYHAGKFQKHLVEKKYPRIPGMRFSHVYEQSLHLGGDFFSVSRIGKGHVGIFVADVMGHGITSAMIALEVKMNLNFIAEGRLSTSEVIGKMNKELIPLMPEGFFVAGFYGIVDISTLEMNYTQFGLPRPVLLRCDKFRASPLQPGNMPIGIRVGTEYVEGKTKVRPGDKLLLFTDGCSEQKDSKKRMYGDRRFVDNFKALSARGEKDIVGTLHRNVKKFAGRQPITDDIAILLCEFSRCDYTDKKTARSSSASAKK